MFTSRNLNPGLCHVILITHRDLVGPCRSRVLRTSVGLRAQCYRPLQIRFLQLKQLLQSAMKIQMKSYRSRVVARKIRYNIIRTLVLPISWHSRLDQPARRPSCRRSCSSALLKEQEGSLLTLIDSWIRSTLTRWIIILLTILNLQKWKRIDFQDLAQNTMTSPIDSKETKCQPTIKVKLLSTRASFWTHRLEIY